MAITLGALAAHAGAELLGDADATVRSIRALDQAGKDDLSFVTRTDYRERAIASAAGALIVPRALADLERPLLVADDPKLALARVLEVFSQATRSEAGIHSTAVIDQGAKIDPAALIGPYAVIGAGTEVEASARIGAHVVIGRECRIGRGTVLYPHVVLYDRTRVGAGCILHAGTVLGADGFGYAHTREGHVKMPHLGHTTLGDAVEIGALSAVDRALTGATRVGDGTKIDNLVQVGHNVTIGRDCILCGQVGIAGTAELADAVVMGGQSGAGDHVRLGRGAQVAARSAVLQSIDDGAVVGGVPAVDLGSWRRQVVSIRQLGRSQERIRQLERRLRDLEDERDEA